MSYSYFENKDCEFYPCHKTEDLNCLFCFCPFYLFDDCEGTPKYIKGENGESIKDCSYCIFPHKRENYEKIIKRLSREKEPPID